MAPLYLPAGIGVAALAELPRVAWRDLDFAYTGDEREGASDVEASLHSLGVADAWPDAIDALYSNIFHQGTVYEATAHAVPFLAAVAAGTETDEALRRQLVVLLTDIALSASFEAADGGSAGAFGDGVQDRIREALLASAPRYEAIAVLSPVTREAFPAILALATESSKPRYDAVVAANQALCALPELPDPEPPPGPIIRYRHPKLGDATLVRRQDNGLLLRFDDGRERVIRESYVVVI